MQMENRTGHLLFHQAVQSVEAFAAYLKQQERRFAPHPGFGGRKQSGSTYILSKIEEALSHARRDGAKLTGQADLLDY